MAFSKTLLSLAVLATSATAANIPAKRYYCHEYKGDGTIGNQETMQCMQMPHLTGPTEGMALEACQATCGSGSLWPQPTGERSVATEVLPLDACQMLVTYDRKMFAGKPVGNLLQLASENFMDTVARESTMPFPPVHCTTPWWQWYWTRPVEHKSRLPFEVVLDVAEDDAELKLDTDESYELKVEQVDVERGGSTVTEMKATIKAKNFFGARQGMETLSQLVTYDPTNKVFEVPTSVSIKDSPTFAYRGFMLDSSRNFFDKAHIKHTLRAMSYSKMNTLHWHFSDTSSFPIETPTRPKVGDTGAYGPDMMYSQEDVKEIVDYATARGIRVIPELDIPAHVNAGWAWGEEEGLGKLMVCDTGYSNGKKWFSHALEPPTGQMNPVNPNTQKVLKDVYGDILDAFKTPDMFHLGGDEIIIGTEGSWASCWNETGNPVQQYIMDSTDMDINDASSFYKIWIDFTVESTNSLKAQYAARGKSVSKILQWAGNHLAEPVIYNIFMYEGMYQKACPPAEFIAMVWDDSQTKPNVDAPVGNVAAGTPSAASEFSIVPRLIDQGYDIVLANGDFVYLDCGGPGWVKPGGYWCGPYTGWWKMYDYPSSVMKLWSLTKDQMTQVKGAETLMWAETADMYNFDSKVWPRTAGLAGSLWSHNGEPDFISNDVGVDNRFQSHRHRLVRRGIHAEALQPKWCSQNGQSCTLPFTQVGADLSVDYTDKRNVPIPSSD